MRKRSAQRVGAIGVLVVFMISCGQPIGPAVMAPGSPPRMTTIDSSEFGAAFAAQPSGGISMESINSVAGVRAAATSLALKKSQTLYISGWAFPSSEKGACSAIGLAVDGKRVFAGLYGYERADVAAAYKDVTRTSVGYALEVPAKSLGTGLHHAYVVCMDSAKSGSRSFTPLTLTVH